MSIVSQALRIATEKATEIAASGNCPERVKVEGASRDESVNDIYWRRMIAIDVDDAVRKYGDAGEWMPGYLVHYFSDDMRVGEGCDQCLGTGRIGVFVRDELEPYLCERGCPNCVSSL